MRKSTISRLVIHVVFGLSCLVLGDIAAAASYSIGGTLSGLGAGKSVTLLNNGGNALVRTVNGSFVFSTKIATGGSYKVTVGTQPTGQKCTVSNGTGTVGTANVTTVVVKCVNTYTIGGSLVGLGVGKSVTLLNNGGNALIRTVNGSFVFSAKIATGGSYKVTVGSQPAGQICTVTNGAGTVLTANITNVAVQCVNAYTIGGAITGLVSGESLTLVNNGSDPLTRTVNGTFKFRTLISLGGSYDVMIGRQPSNQTCRVANGEGTNVTANVTTVLITCGALARYTMTNIGSLGGTATWGAAINRFGDIAGAALTADGSKHAFLYRLGAIIDLGTMGGPSSDAFALNDSGQVVGIVNRQGDCSAAEPFIYQYGVMQPLVAALCDDYTKGGYARAINSWGAVALEEYSPYDTDMKVVFKGQTIGARLEAAPIDINDGYVLFRDVPNYATHPSFSIGSISYMDGYGAAVQGESIQGVEPWDIDSYATALNGSNQVTGTAYFSGGSDDSPGHAFLYSAGKMIDLGTLGGSTSTGKDINDLGHVVGVSRIPDGKLHAFFYSKATGMLDLNKLVPPIDSAGTYLRTARAINNQGMIVVNATNKRTYLLVPAN